MSPAPAWVMMARRMLLDVRDVLDLLLLTAGYWLVDRATRLDGLLAVLRRVGIRTPTAVGAIVLGVAALAAPWWRWEAVPDGEAVRLLGVALATMLTWKGATKDIDPVFGDRDRVARWLLVAAWLGSWLSPALLVPVALLASSPFALWEHHATLPMRILIAVVAWLLGTAAAGAFGGGAFVDAAALVWFVLTIQISHYLITALAKIWLGPWPWSWVVDNRMHHLAATAYSWGWGRFVPWATWRRFIGVLRFGEIPMQAFAFGVELLAPFALVDPIAGVVFCCAWAGFHVGVFAVSGLLFWDWILADLAVAAMLLALPATTTAQAFGWVPLVAALVYMAALPMRHKLWKPIPLGWWDTPFAQRVHWVVTGESGARYGLHNDFMCPNERLYGKVHACFLAPRKGITYHLGEVWKRDLRDLIRAAGPDPERLDAIRATHGIQARDDALAANHVAYLKRFFHALNHGADKRVLPGWLGWLKAPGDQIFYWGELPRYRGQEPVRRVSLIYREEYFDGERLVRLCDEPVLDIDIDETAKDATCRPEPTPKEIDDLLLAEANGKIIDLPDFGGGYVDSDDGKAREPEGQHSAS